MPNTHKLPRCGKRNNGESCNNISDTIVIRTFPVRDNNITRGTYLLRHAVVAVPGDKNHYLFGNYNNKNKRSTDVVYCWTRRAVIARRPSDASRAKNTPPRWRPFHLHLYIKIYTCMYIFILFFCFLQFSTPDGPRVMFKV